VKTQLAQQLTDKHPQVLEAALAMTPDMVLQVGSRHRARLWCY
jgi:hypothetical protein